MNRLFQRGKLVGDRPDIPSTPDYFGNQLRPAAMILGRLDLGVDRLPEEYTEPWLDVLASHSRWLGTVVYARLRDRHAVEEVMQETALAGWKFDVTRQLLSLNLPDGGNQLLPLDTVRYRYVGFEKF